MKGYKFLVPIFLVVIYGLSIYMMCSERQKIADEYNKYITVAREKRADGISKDAEAYYMQALEVKDSVELKVEIGEFYREIGMNRKALDWGETLLDEYKDEVEPYEYVFDIYYDSGNKMACFQLYDTLTKRGLESKDMTTIIDSWEYEYYIDECEYEDVGDFKDGACLVKDDEKWGYANSDATMVISSRFKKAGPFSENLAPVYTSQSEAFFIDTDGDKKKIVKNIENVFEIGMIEKGIFSVFNGFSWSFYNEAGEKISQDYDKVSNISNERAAVMLDGSWSIINASGEVISSELYESIIMDDNDIIMHSERIFVEKNKCYYMLDKDCERVNATKYEDADGFRGGELAAIKLDGKWGFINSTGEVVIAPKYDEARSFFCGHAAVKVDGKWGFIDEEENMVIEPIFDDVKDFTTSGTVFVKQGVDWNMLKLYKYNH